MSVRRYLFFNSIIFERKKLTSSTVLENTELTLSIPLLFFNYNRSSYNTNSYNATEKFLFVNSCDMNKYQ